MYFRVEIDGGGFIDSRFGIRTRGKMMASLVEYERWLAEVRGFYERVQFYFRGELLNNRHRLSYFTNVQEGEVINAVVGIVITFQYDGSRLDKYSMTFRGSSRTKLTSFERRFKTDYFHRVGRNADVEFQYYLDGRKLSALGDYGNHVNMNGQVMFVVRLGTHWEVKEEI